VSRGVGEFGRGLTVFENILALHVTFIGKTLHYLQPVVFFNVLFSKELDLLHEFNEDFSLFNCAMLVRLLQNSSQELL